MLKCVMDVIIACHVFPGSLTLENSSTALSDARAKWIGLGVVLGLSYGTLEVIEGRAVSSLSNYVL